MVFGFSSSISWCNRVNLQAKKSPEFTINAERKKVGLTSNRECSRVLLLADDLVEGIRIGAVNDLPGIDFVEDLVKVCGCRCSRFALRRGYRGWCWLILGAGGVFGSGGNILRDIFCLLVVGGITDLNPQRSYVGIASR